jgi:signal transduction histidine kinase/DNA-binding response OmpR family regulator
VLRLPVLDSWLRFPDKPETNDHGNLAMKEPTLSARLLLVEDDAGLATLLSRLLTGAGHHVDVANRASQALENFASRRDTDLALLDYGLPDMQGIELITTAQTRGILPPFLVLTGRGDERLAVELMKLGAVDYLVKDASLLDRLPGAVARALNELATRRQLEQAEAALRQSESELAAIHEHAPIMMLLLDDQRRIHRLNHAAAEFAGTRDHAARGMLPSVLFQCDYARDQEKQCGNAEPCSVCDFNRLLLDTQEHGTRHRRVEVQPKFLLGREMRDVTLLMSTARVEVTGRKMVLLCLEDVTEQKRLESQLRHAQRMEAVGQLAGGVAHDFNNILTGTLMHLGMLQSDPRVGADMREPLRELEVQTQRAAALTRQLLLFSRRQVLQPRPVQLNELMDNMLKMLRRLLGEHIAIEFDAFPNLPQLKADPGMLEQVVMNLCVNARDAMPNGGQLSLRTETLNIRRDQLARFPEAHEGPYVRLTVTDTGCGMDAAVQSRLFEPFFTTKEAGKGTGLGLATVFGIVKQHQGWIEVKSAPDLGSRFFVYLPASHSNGAQPAPAPAPEPARGGHETILVVEDDSSVRRLITTALVRQGYNVLTASDGQEGLRKFEQHRGNIDLLFSDMVMPGVLSGLDLAEQLRQRKPGLRVIICSGYSVDINDSGRARPQDIDYLPKPCTQSALARAVRNCLDRPDSP